MMYVAVCVLEGLRLYMGHVGNLLEKASVLLLHIKIIVCCCSTNIVMVISSLRGLFHHHMSFTLLEST